MPYDSPVIDSYSTFGRSYDLFGDGSVRLVATPGHTHGHQSVILRLKDREALVTGDAVYFTRTIDDERRGWVMADEHKWRRSVGEIRLYRRENPDALIIPGHDAEAWAQLSPATSDDRPDRRRAPATRHPRRGAGRRAADAGGHRGRGRLPDTGSGPRSTIRTAC